MYIVKQLCGNRRAEYRSMSNECLCRVVSLINGVATGEHVEPGPLFGLGQVMGLVHIQNPLEERSQKCWIIFTSETGKCECGLLFRNPGYATVAIAKSFTQCYLESQMH